MYIFSHFASQIFYAFADGADESLILCSLWTHFAELFRYASPLFTENDGNKKRSNRDSFEMIVDKLIR